MNSKSSTTTKKTGRKNMTNSFTEIDVTDLVENIVVSPAPDVPTYFGRLIDAIFNRPVELNNNRTTLTKTTIRQMYKRAYPRAKV